MWSSTFFCLNKINDYVILNYSHLDTLGYVPSLSTEGKEIYFLHTLNSRPQIRGDP